MDIAVFILIIAALAGLYILLTKSETRTKNRYKEKAKSLLELTDPDDLMVSGIDIVARPPGKRQQGLALLSGGERALTATALVFAIMSTSPTPFCVLDEVDAALDEANVGRFRTVLQSLAQETQFVIITHNRYTIEIADIVYGITMSGDGSSRVISHRLSQEQDEQPAAAPAV